MTMEMVESQQDDNVVASVSERGDSHLQNRPGQSQFSSRSEVYVGASSAGRGCPAVTLVQLRSDQIEHVQGVIQATQPSVIKSPHLQTAQVASIADKSSESEGITESQKRREVLARRPSYRKILNELSSDAPAVPKIEEEKSEDEGASSGISATGVLSSLYHANAGQYITLTQSGAIQISAPASDVVHGLQTFTMTNSGAPQAASAVVQYTGHSSDSTQQFFVSGSQVLVQAATGDMPAYQLRTPTTALPQGVVMTASPGTLHSPQQLAEEATRKRELRLMKNREAAKECRRRKKEYIKCLESRVAVLELQNKKLIEELETLKDICSSETD
ncbi:cAMP-responsive element modulator isoform X2 [Colius striatus]|uniref:cAMP-responsive element modulator isoform X2 n=1 Tax=Colius striatus TaxID=57412 RepID=UPI002B1E572E|nr:cAMP-responsive element modulator isoform X2 [Colius striatus]